MSQHHPTSTVGILVFVLVSFLPCGKGWAQDIFPISLNGDWDLQIDGEQVWHSVTVPGTFQQQLGHAFDGIGTYRKFIQPIEVPDQRRLILRFQAVATHAQVWFNGEAVGEHLGGWTPFFCDVTDAARSPDEGLWEIRVRVDERVGHNTQGFLPVFAPHFGGIWQGVSLDSKPSVWLNRDRFQLIGDPASRQLIVSGKFERWSPECGLDLLIGIDAPEQRHRFRVTNLIDHQSPLAVDAAGRFAARLELPNLESWTPDAPRIHRANIDVTVSTNQQIYRESFQQGFGVRSVRTNGDRLLLGGRPVVVRGLLNWGYAPPRNAPSLDESFMRNEIQFAKDRGFNLMKFCLWIPPKRYLELCDEMGMLAWVEYPTWHPDFSPERMEELRNEYDEFFFFDRNHPSVILRSLTCETGPSADLDVIRALYNQCKQRIPGAIVEDDSSWIQWNRVHDFYDDHPYGNNHTWVEELDRLRQYISERESKPLILGEAIAADTWFDPNRVPESLDHEVVFWLPRFLPDSRRWIAKATRKYGKTAVDRLAPDSKTYAYLMRKYQIETFHRTMPHGGYVVSVIRDFPFASMGLIDFWDRPKWEPDAWSWHGDTMLLLQTENDRRSFVNPWGDDDRRIPITILVKRGGQTSNGPAVLSASLDGRPLATSFEVRPDAENDRIELTPFTFEISSLDVLDAATGPQRRVLRAKLVDQQSGSILAQNHWPIWIVPQAEFGATLSGAESDDQRVSSDQNVSAQKESLFIHPSASALRSEVGYAEWQDQLRGNPLDHPALVLTHEMDESLLDLLEAGGNVILLADGEQKSFPLKAHWFLRGGPIVSDRSQWFPSDDNTDPGDGEQPRIPRQMIVELQHFDLAGDVIPHIEYLESVNPLIMLWENHDLHTVRTNGLLFHMPVGERGNLYVSALNHFGHGNAAGRYILAQMIHGVLAGQMNDGLPRLDTGPETLAKLRRELRGQTIQLERLSWRFKVDGQQRSGLDNGWHKKHFDDRDWETIQANRHWESQGHDTLDYWAWYRIDVAVPNEWDTDSLYLNFTGVDDYYDLYVNGEHIGSGGDIEKRETAFEECKSHDLSKFARSDEPLQIAVAVYDWYGAGGIFRPVSLSTQPLSEEPRLLK